MSDLPLEPTPGDDRTRELVERARQGDARAYDELFARTSERVLLFIRLRLGKGLRANVDSMDVLQEAYTEAHRDFARFEHRDEQAFARWLCGIVENRIRGLADHFDAKKRRAPGGEVPVSRILELHGASATGPATAAGKREEHEALERAMEQLEVDEREALLQRHFQDRTLEEIAASLGKSETAVRRLLGKATARLGRLLQGKPDADV